MFKLLETFKVVYETRSFSKAAELLFVSQPTVSTHIRQLEQEIGCSLFTRNGRTNIQVTPAADTLYQAALTIVDNWQQVQESLQEKQLEQARLTLGVSHTFAVYLLPELLIFLYHQFPNTHFQVKQLNSWEVLQAMEHHEIDLGVIEKPLASHAVQRTPLLVDQLVLVDTSTGPWLVRETSSGVYYYTKRYFEEQNIQEPSVTIENNEIILALLKKGLVVPLSLSVQQVILLIGHSVQTTNVGFTSCIQTFKKSSRLHLMFRPFLNGRSKIKDAFSKNRQLRFTKKRRMTNIYRLVIRRFYLKLL